VYCALSSAIAERQACFDLSSQAQVGERLTRRDKKEQFWKSTFSVYDNEELIGACEKEQKNIGISAACRDRV
jgi:hypothetical protein